MRQRQDDLCEFETSLVYRVSSRIARTVAQRNCLEKTKQNNQIKKIKRKLHTFKLQCQGSHIHISSNRRIKIVRPQDRPTREDTKSLAPCTAYEV